MPASKITSADHGVLRTTPGRFALIRLPISFALAFMVLTPSDWKRQRRLYAVHVRRAIDLALVALGAGTNNPAATPDLPAPLASGVPVLLHGAFFHNLLQ